MITRFTSIEELKQIWYELLFNNTDKVTKVSNEAALNAIGYGIGKVGQKSLKEIAIIESHLFPENAFGEHLDTIAKRRGIASRFSASQSSTLIRIVASPGTTYIANTNIFSGDGIIFRLIQDITIGQAGYTYAKVRSDTTGSRTNVAPLTITSVSPKPSGHITVFNEYAAQGGRDIESDDLFRLRIRKGANLAARHTLDYLTQIFQKLNSDILGVYHYGLDNSGKLILAVSTQNGIDLTTTELDNLLTQVSPYLTLSDYDYITGNSLNIVLRNVEYEYIDISIRADISRDQSIDLTRIELQTNLSKEIDFRFWNPGDRVEWDNLLQIVKSHPMMKYVSDANFFPNTDIIVPVNRLPRIRGFILMDLNGDLIIDNNSVINPIYYPNEIDFSFQQTVLSSI